jgi:Ca2+-binding RTX toxin-like protein
LGGATFSVQRSVPGDFSYYDPTAGGLVNTATDLVPGSVALSRNEQLDPPTAGNLFSEQRPDGSRAYAQRVDIKVTPADVAAGVKYVVTVTGAAGKSTLRVVNAVDIDLTTLVLTVTGTDKCGDYIGVFDDPGVGNTTDAKRILFGAIDGQLNGGANLAFSGVQYNTDIVNAIFGGNPTISRIDVNSLGGDDIIRVEDKLTQQSVILAGAGNDIVRGGNEKTTAYGEDGHDSITGGRADDVFSGGNGNDALFGAAGADRLYGGAGDDWLGGGDNDDPIIKGDFGNDRLSGGAGKDRLYGDTGTDIGYRQLADLTISGIEISVLVAPDAANPDLVDLALLDVIRNVWRDGVADANDTIDELMASMGLGL